MSINISVSNDKNTGCKKILDKFFKAGIQCRTLETISIVGNNIERGCLITIGDQDVSKDNVYKIWNKIHDDYTCAHLKIDGLYSGCIYNYIKSDYCPGL